MIFVFIALICLIIYLYVFYNKLDLIKTNMSDSLKKFDEDLKIEWELIPQLIKSLKKYYEKEKRILDELILIRNKLYDKLTIEEKIMLNYELVEKTNQINLLVKKYKGLEDDIHFKAIINETKRVEKQVIDDLKLYNEEKTQYEKNTKFILNKWLSKLN